MASNDIRRIKALLRQSLMNLRMAFVETADDKTGIDSNAPAGKEIKTEAAKVEAQSAPEDENRKKFTKKY